MRVFVSHCKDDDVLYQALRLVLKGHNLDCWDVASMSQGKSLPVQLSNAIKKCDVCLFVATAKSLQSPWCLAEAGAFWGAEKPVMILNADNEEITNLPQFQDILRTRDIEPIIEEMIRIRAQRAVQSESLTKRYHVFFSDFSAGSMHAVEETVDFKILPTEFGISRLEGRSESDSVINEWGNPTRKEWNIEGFLTSDRLVYSYVTVHGFGSGAGVYYYTKSGGSWVGRWRGRDMADLKTVEGNCVCSEDKETAKKKFESFPGDAKICDF